MAEALEATVGIFAFLKNILGDCENGGIAVYRCFCFWGFVVRGCGCWVFGFWVGDGLPFIDGVFLYVSRAEVYVLFANVYVWLGIAYVWLAEVYVLFAEVYVLFANVYVLFATVYVSLAEKDVWLAEEDVWSRNAYVWCVDEDVDGFHSY